MPPALGNGKICYIEIPATDISRSAHFYARSFGWNIRRRGDGATAFDDGQAGAEFWGVIKLSCNSCNLHGCVPS